MTRSLGLTPAQIKHRQQMYMHQWTLANRDKIQAAKPWRGTYRRLKEEIIEAYGGCCACCGEETKEFLTFDHINEDGASERKGLRSNSNTTLWIRLRREGFPDRGTKYQVLCYNCNCGRYRNGGICPSHGDGEVLL